MIASMARMGKLLRTVCTLLLVTIMTGACGATDPVALAQSWEYNVCDVPALVDDAMADALDRIHDTGYSVVHYENLPDCEDAYARTNVVTHTVRLCKAFFDMSDEEQVSTLYHELTHIYTAMGEGEFFMLEAHSDTDLRWAVETVGFRQNIITLSQLGVDMSDYDYSERASMLDSYSTAYGDNLDNLTRTLGDMSHMCN